MKYIKNFENKESELHIGRVYYAIYEYNKDDNYIFKYSNILIDIQILKDSDIKFIIFKDKYKYLIYAFPSKQNDIYHINNIGFFKSSYSDLTIIDINNIIEIIIKDFLLDNIHPISLEDLEMYINSNKFNI